MLIFLETVFDDGVVGTTKVSIPSEWWPVLAQADKLLIQADVTNVVGGPSTFELYASWSNDGVDFDEDSLGTSGKVISKVLANKTNTTAFGTLDGSTMWGTMLRLEAKMTGSDGVRVRLLVAGHAKIPSDIDQDFE